MSDLLRLVTCPNVTGHQLQHIHHIGNERSFCCTAQTPSGSDSFASRSCRLMTDSATSEHLLVAQHW